MRSLFYHTPEFLNVLSVCPMTRLVTYLGAFGGPTVQPIELFTTLPRGTCAGLVQSYKSAGERTGHKDKLFTEGPRHKKRKEGQVGWSSTGWVNGQRKKMAKSSAYPREFCLAVALAAETALSRG